MTTIYSVYDQLAELIAKLEPEKIIELKASDDVQKRFDFLIKKRKESEISAKENDELNHFIVLERIFRLAKIKAAPAVK